MVEEQKEKFARIAEKLTGHGYRRLNNEPEPDNIKRLHAAGYTNVRSYNLSIAPALLMARMGKPEGLDQLRLWLDCGGDVDARPRSGGRLLLRAIGMCNADAAALLIRRGASTEGALHQLCGLEDFPRAVEIARLLVDAGEDVNAVRERRHDTKMVPLRDAVFNGYDDVVHLLLSRGAKTDWYEQLWRPRGTLPPSKSQKLIAVVLAAGGWLKYTLPPRKDMLVLRELCEKDRAKPSAQSERLFALPKGVFWRVISFWRSHLDEPHRIDGKDYAAALTKQPTAQEYNLYQLLRAMPGMNLDEAGTEAFRQQLVSLNIIPADAVLPAPRDTGALPVQRPRFLLDVAANPRLAARQAEARQHLGLPPPRYRVIEGTVATSVATAGVAAEGTAAEETAETPIAEESGMPALEDAPLEWPGSVV